MQRKQRTVRKRLTKKTERKTRQNKIQSKDEVQCQEQQNESCVQQENSRIYCKNSNLLREMFKWKNSTKLGIHVLKKVKGKYVETERWNIEYEKDGSIYKKIGKERTLVEENCDLAQHERYKKGTKYFIKYPLNHERTKLFNNKKVHIKIVRKTKDGYIEDVTENVKRMGYAFDIDDNEDHRTISNEFGLMLMKIGQKVSNHSFFRQYTKELKEDMQAYSFEKTIRGLPNYNFKYDNAFSYITQAFFNSFKSILSKHYKQVNIKRDCTKRAMLQLQSTIPNSSMERCLGNQFRGNDYDGFEEF